MEYWHAMVNQFNASHTIDLIKIDAFLFAKLITAKTVLPYSLTVARSAGRDTRDPLTINLAWYHCQTPEDYKYSHPPKNRKQKAIAYLARLVNFNMMGVAKIVVSAAVLAFVAATNAYNVQLVSKSWVGSV